MSYSSQTPTKEKEMRWNGVSAPADMLGGPIAHQKSSIREKVSEGETPGTPVSMVLVLLQVTAAKKGERSISVFSEQSKEKRIRAVKRT